MEAFDMAACLEDNLLDFGSDVGEEDEGHNKKSKINSSSSLNPNRSFPVSVFLSWVYALLINILGFVFLEGAERGRVWC